MLQLRAMTPVCLGFRSLSCQRITLHKNLFLSFVLNSVVTAVWLTTVVKKQGHAYNDTVSLWRLLQVSVGRQAGEVVTRVLRRPAVSC